MWRLANQLYLLAAVLVVASTTTPANTLKPEVFNSETHLPTQAAKTRAANYVQLGNVRVLDTLLKAPQVDKIQVRFRIYNRRAATEGIEFAPLPANKNSSTWSAANPFGFDLALLAGSQFDAINRTKTVVMVPGYRSGERSKWVTRSRQNWLELDDVNVIEVDWSKNSLNRGLYSEAVALTPLVARQITILLHYLAQLNGFQVIDEKFAGKLHLIGHSLGAHICGFVGKDLGQQRVGRITGLDPAGPSFDLFDNLQRLHKSDAKLVEALHTNSGQIKYKNLAASMPLWALGNLPGGRSLSNWFGRSYTGEGDTAWFGINLQLAHLDYYANSGRVQPGCTGLMHFCDHNRAAEIYAQIMAYETRLRSELAHIVGDSRRKQMVEQSRLLAFNSLDYNRFLDGASLAEHCPKLMSIGKHLSVSSIGQTLSNCALPIDLLAPVDSILGDLKTRNNGVADEELAAQPSYYFKTLSGDNLVGLHFLVKLYLSKESDWDSNKCSLTLRMRMHKNEEKQVDGDNVEEVELDLGKLEEANEHLVKEMPIASPFIHPDGAGASAALVELLWQNSDSLEVAMGDETVVRGSKTEQLIERLMPQEIVLTIERPKSPSVWGTVTSVVKNSLLRLVSRQLRPEQVDCKLSLKMVEVHPINGHRDNLAGLYAQTASGSEFPVQMARDMAPQLERRPKVTVSRLASDSNGSVSLKLNSIVIG